MTAIAGYLGAKLAVGVLYAAGAAIIFALIGNIADIVYQTAYGFVKNVLYVNDGGFFTDFNFFGSGTEEKTSMFSYINASDDYLSKFLMLIWLLAWVLFIICACKSIIRVIANGDKLNVGQAVKTGLRILIVAVFLSQWYLLCDKFLQGVTLFINGSDNSILTMSYLEENIKGLEELMNNVVNNFGYDEVESVGENMSLFIVAIIIEFSLGTTLIGAAMNYIERYIIMAFYFYMSPLYLALTADESMSSNIKDWLLGLLPQVVGIVLNAFMIYLGLQVLCVTDGSIMSTSNATLIRTTLATAIFALTMYSEQFFGMFGVSTMTIGSTVGMLAAGSAVGMRVVKNAHKDVTKAIKGQAGFVKYARNLQFAQKSTPVYKQGLQQASSLVDAYKQSKLRGVAKVENAIATKNSIGEIKKAMQTLSKDAPNYDLVYGQLKEYQATLQADIDKQCLKGRAKNIVQITNLAQTEIKDLATFKAVNSATESIKSEFNSYYKGRNDFSDKVSKEGYNKTYRAFMDVDENGKKLENPTALRKVEANLNEFKTEYYQGVKNEMSKSIIGLSELTKNDEIFKADKSTAMATISTSIVAIKEADTLVKALYDEDSGIAKIGLTKSDVLTVSAQLDMVKSELKTNDEDEKALLDEINATQEEILTIDKDSLSEKETEKLEKLDKEIEENGVEEAVEKRLTRELYNQEQNALKQFEASFTKSLIDLEKKKTNIQVEQDKENEVDTCIIRESIGFKDEDKNIWSLAKINDQACTNFKSYNTTPDDIVHNYSQSLNGIYDSATYELADRNNLLNEQLGVVEVKNGKPYFVGFATKVIPIQVDADNDPNDPVNDITSNEYAILTSDRYRAMMDNRFSEKYDYSKGDDISYFFAFHCNSIGGSNDVKGIEDSDVICLGNKLNYDNETDNFMFEKGVENYIADSNDVHRMMQGIAYKDGIEKLYDHITNNRFRRKRKGGD